MFDVPLDLGWFVVGEAIIALHPLTNALITLVLLRPYREALRRLALPRRAVALLSQRIPLLCSASQRSTTLNGTAGRSSTESIGGVGGVCGDARGETGEDEPDSGPVSV